MKKVKIPKVKFSSNLVQPILTIVLIALIVFFVFKSLPGDTFKKDNSYKQVTRDVSFSEAADNFLNSSFQVYTRGSLLVKSSNTTSTKNIDPSKQNTSSPSNQVQVTENKYDDLFFYVDKSAVKRIDLKSYTQNESLFFNEKKEIVFVSNSTKSYTLYPVPGEDQKDAKLLFDSTNQIMQQLFPLVPLIQDYKQEKFNPVLRSYNLYSGKWQHPLFTSGEVVDVILETDPISGLFRSFNVSHSFITTPSSIFFDFKKYDINSALYATPSDYKSLPVDAKYLSKKK